MKHPTFVKTITYCRDTETASFEENFFLSPSSSILKAICPLFPIYKGKKFTVLKSLALNSKLLSKTNTFTNNANNNSNINGNNSINSPPKHSKGDISTLIPTKTNNDNDNNNSNNNNNNNEITSSSSLLPLPSKVKKAKRERDEKKEGSKKKASLEKDPIKIEH